jgi:hypothetical protein
MLQAGQLEVHVGFGAVAHVVDKGDLGAQEIGVAGLTVEEHFQLRALRRLPRVLRLGTRRRDRVEQARRQKECSTKQVHSCDGPPRKDRLTTAWAVTTDRPRAIRNETSGFNLSLTYTFGSIFSSIVNPRFGN